MNKLALLLSITLAFSNVAVWAGSDQQGIINAESTTPLTRVPLTLFEFESGYVFESEVTRHGVGFGDQDALNTQFDFAQRIHLSGNLYWHFGLEYERFDFGRTSGPLPIHLQSLAGVVGVDYMHGADVGAFIQVKPGIFTEEHIGISSFDAPITAGRIWVLQPDKLYVFTGVNASFLRGRFPVLPLLGVIWIPNQQWRLMGVLPEPRLIYSPTRDLDIWAGGEFVGGSFRTDRDNTIRPPKLNGAEVDYSEYRAGLGFAYGLSNAVTVDFGGGYAIEREFDFNRAGKTYDTDPAPYLRLEIKAKF